MTLEVLAVEVRSAQLAHQDRIADTGLISDDARKNKEDGLFTAAHRRRAHVRRWTPPLINAGATQWDPSTAEAETLASRVALLYPQTEDALVSAPTPDRRHTSPN